jgi:Fur family ferric uptake transcriptional regulator
VTQKTNNIKEFSILGDYLKSVGQFFTQPRKIILESFLQMEGHISVKRLCEKVKKADPQISQGTVYRTMKLLVGCGLASENEFIYGRKCFEKNHGREHHDHMVCAKCTKVEEFHNTSIERLQEEVARSHKFEMTSHRMTLFGVCNDCQ